MFVPYTGNFQYHEVGWLGSAAIVQGALVRFDVATGYLEPSTVSATIDTDGTQYAVNMSATQTASATNGATKTLVVPLESGQVWKVDTTGDMVQTHVGKICSLTSAVAIDEDDFANWPTFKIVGYVGALADRKALVTPQFSAAATGLDSGIVKIGI